MKGALGELLKEIRACRFCAAHLPLGPRPVLRPSATATLLIVGQAPGRRVHETGIPWNDPSGDRLRAWLGLSRQEFYDPRKVAIVPIGFCYPGSGLRGDLPPRPECAPLWQPRLLALMPRIRLVLLVGAHAQAYHLGRKRKPTVAATVAAAREFLPGFLPLPHPSPRNRRWFIAHPWFERRIVPLARRRVRGVLVTSPRGRSPRPTGRRNTSSRSAQSHRRPGRGHRRKGRSPASRGRGPPAGGSGST